MAVTAAPSIERFLADRYVEGERRAREHPGRIAPVRASFYADADPGEHPGLGHAIRASLFSTSFDPAWVLADIEVKRLILREHRSADGWDRQPDRPHAARIRVCRCCADKWVLDGQPRSALIGLDYPCQTVRLLAYPFRELDGYDPLWVPHDL